MKKLLLIIGLISTTTFSQDCVAPVMMNFECTPVQTVSGVYSSTSNAFSGGINTSANIGAYTDDASNQWDALVIDFGAPIDLSVNNILKIKLYSPTRSIELLSKLENAGNTQSATRGSAASQVGQWQEFSFDYSDEAANTKSLQKVVFFFDPYVGSGSHVYYFDDVTWSSSTLSTKNDALDSSEFLVYPNPVRDMLKIRHSSGIEQVRVTNVLGKTVISVNVNSMDYELDLSVLNKGIYFVKVSTDNNFRTFKVLKR
ncbi:T9SS type A sorting domain-containing protein [Seonamhaeicola sp.]|uniref:T9SS type A sorting domain-containing protein n=1 Tax=Seonamhaeicola sp. TaxID=1912245 RepID=UPI0026033B34|nr:T9SS type A sorting domain-containing protein [Seonamhaeicola sp.]